MTYTLHPQLIPSLVKSGKFPSQCTVQGHNSTQDTFGEEAHTWVDISGMTALSCVVGDKSKAESVGNSTPEVFDGLVLLAGHYPAVTSDMRVVIDEVAYDIVQVRHPQVGILTELAVKRVM